MIRKSASHLVRKHALCTFALLLTLALAGCGSNGSNDLRADYEADPDPMATSQDQLRTLVRAMITDTRRKADESGAEMRNYKPYFFKEFNDYPEGPDAYEIDFIESESRVAPMLADVRIKQLRFVTEVRDRRTDAQTDGGFMREVGTQTISYEFRNGDWDRTASLFVADEVQHLVNGVWEELPPQPKEEVDLLAVPDRDGFFRRAFGRFRLGDNETGPE